MLKNSSCSLAIVLCAAAVHTACVRGQTLEFRAVADVWIRELSPTHLAYEDDLISVWSSHSSDGARRCGLIEFDLSTLAGANIAEVRLALYSGNHGYSDYGKPIKQRAYVFDCPSGVALRSLTWNNYVGQIDPTKAALATLGGYDLPAASQDPAQQNKYVESVGTAADAAVIQAAVNRGGRVCMVLVADEQDGVDYAHSWGDDGWYHDPGYPPLLTVSLVSTKAYMPVPADQATGVGTDVRLSWQPGQQAVSHDIYLGTNQADVFNATDPHTPPGRGRQPAGDTTFDPGSIDYETTYYWRVDEVGPGGTGKGEVWSFTTIAEALAPAPPVHCPESDTDGDCEVGFGDLMRLAEGWLADGDDFSDFSILAADWGKKIGPLVISEFMASNGSSLPLGPGELLDGNGESSDWLEIYNPTNMTQDLSGWFLTDDTGTLKKWRFPADTSIDGGGYLVIFASQKKEQDYPDNYPYVDSLGYLHTNFALSAGGEYLALVGPDGRRVVHEYADYEQGSSRGFPPQERDVSYGLHDNKMRYFASATPGGANDGSFIDFVADTQFSHARGFYTASFDVSIVCATPDATIYYTTDGSSPIDAGGNPTATATAYTGPFPVASTTCLRAAAAKPGWRPSNVDSQTYLFAGEIVSQPEMDKDVIGPGDLFNGVYTATIREDLQSIPTVSIAMNDADIFGPSGIYTNPQGTGTAWERPCSAELICPDGQEGFQVTCGIRVFGQGGRSWPKKSFRLLFKEPYGPTKLEYKLFADSGVERFDTLVLRSTVDTSWVDVNATVRQRAEYIRDLWTKDTARDMGQEPALHSRYVHLYFNGTYWGLYAVTERPDASYMAENLGGDRADYDAIVSGEAIDGDLTAWNELIAIANAGLGDGVTFGGLPAYEAIEQRLDMDVFIDYILTNLYSCNIDWAGHLQNRNWRAAGPRVPGQGGFRVFSWDAEICFDSGWSNTVRPVDYDNVSTMGDWDLTPARLYQRLKANAEYRIRFADRAHRHLFNGGALTPQSVQKRWMARAAEIDRAIVAESARWGDERQSIPLTRNIDWMGEQNRLLSQWFPHRTDILVDLLRQNGLYPSVDAPMFNVDGVHQHGGYIRADSDITMTLPSLGPAAMTYEKLIASFAPCRVLVPTDDALRASWYLPDFVPDAAWTNGLTGVGYDYPGLIKTDVGSQMSDPYTSVYVRMSFTLNAETLATIESLILRLKYEDGFVAWLNGVKMASDNADWPLVWAPIPAATASRPDSQAVQFRDFDLTTFIGVLHAGTNVLAIQGLNVPGDSTDLLALPELVAGRPDDGGPGLPPGVAIYYTTDGSDPRLPGGALNTAAIAYPGTIRLAGGTDLKARTFDGNTSTWSALNEAVYAIDNVRQNLRVTEIMYHPEDAPNGRADAEFIELRNTGDEALDLGLVRFTKGIDFEFGSRTLPPVASVIVVKDEAVFRQYYPDSANVIAGAYSGRLADEGERIRLEDALGNVILDFFYSDGWRDITDGGGFSLTVIDPAGTPVDEWGFKRTWRASVRVGGSPGADDGGLLPNPDDLVINEVLAHSHGQAPDWIELYNAADHDIELEGWFLSDSDADEASLMKYEIHDVQIPARGFVVFREDVHFNNSGDVGCRMPFGLSENGEMVCLSSPTDGHQRLTGYRRKEVFGASATNVAFGRYRTSTGDDDFVAMSENTPGAGFEGAPNAYPKVGPVVISEIMYHPDWPTDSPLDNDAYAYIELLNITDAVVALENDGLPWRFTKGVDFVFPSSTTLNPGARIVVAANPEAFSWRYPSVPTDRIFGPFAHGTTLSHAGEAVELSQPGDFDGGGQHYIRIDRVRYSDGGHPDDFDGDDPWPRKADGQGNSLVRKTEAAYGNDVANWQAGEPSPGF